MSTINTIKLSGKRLLQLINDILDAAKMKQGGIVIKHDKVGNPSLLILLGLLRDNPEASSYFPFAFFIRQVDVCALMKDVTDIAKSLVNRKVTLVNKVPDLPVITADADRLVQIMYNLIGNAGWLCDEA